MSNIQGFSDFIFLSRMCFIGSASEEENVARINECTGTPIKPQFLTCIDVVPYDLCLQCCWELRDGNLQGNKEVSNLFEDLGSGYLEDVDRKDVKRSTRRFVSASPKDQQRMGGCGNRILKLIHAKEPNHVLELLDSAQELLMKHIPDEDMQDLPKELMPEEATTVKNEIGQFNALIAELEGLGEGEDLFDTLHDLRDDRENARAKLQNLNDLIADAEEEVQTKEEQIEAMNG
ncbi:zinc finger, ZZ-type, JmjC domain-containing protein [Artemisia annua]|uniref:Zinc finger, ZZ-type, JmjC domain-containing protein n=1 Tax=Artemisia annua TaxID=35608 RepID=A0A2U1M1P7_ARTAN|nr:zinc finger, ZZ-type, JmjC domain-containing protein [Artemisia annua]